MQMLKRTSCCELFGWCNPVTIRIIVHNASYFQPFAPFSCAFTDTSRIIT